MGMYLSTTLYKEPDQDWLDKKAIYDDCITNNKKVPEEVAKLFDMDDWDDENQDPEDDGFGHDLSLVGQELNVPYADAVINWPMKDAEYPNMLIDIDKLPPGTKKILVKYW